MSNRNRIEETAAIYTNSPKIFCQTLKIVDVSEYGICIPAKKAISDLNTNIAPLTQTEKVHIPFDNAKRTVRLYKELVKYLDIQEVERLKQEHKLLEKIKSHDFSDMYLVYFNILVLFLINKGKYAPLASLYLILSLPYTIDIEEVIKIVRSLLTSEEEKWCLDIHLSEYGLKSLITEDTKSKDAMLYIKSR